MGDKQASRRRKVNALRGLSVATGVVLTLVCSAELAFNVYANALKAQLNFTQSEVALSSSLLSVGAYMAIPCGVLYDRVGVRWNITIGAILCVSGYGLLWMAVVLKAIFSHYNGLVALFYYLCGQGMQFMTFTSLVVNVNNVPIRHRGKVTSALAVAFSAGSVIFALVYDKAISRDNTVPLDAQDLDSFILSIPISLVAAYILSMILIRPYRSLVGEISEVISVSDKENETLTVNDKCIALSDGENEKFEIVNDQGEHVLNEDESDRNLLTSHVNVSPNSHHSDTDNGLLRNSMLATRSLNSLSSLQIANALTDETEKERRKEKDLTAHGTSKNLKAQLKALLKNLKLVNVHLSFWSFALPFGVDLLFIYSSTAFVHTVHLDEHTIFFTTTALVIALVLNFVICSVADSLYSRFKVRHTTVILVLNLTMFLCQVPLVFWSDVYYVLAICDTLTICIGETIYAMTPTLLSVRLGGAEFGLVWGTFMGASGVVSLGIFKGFGAIYDSNIDTDITRECFGKGCLTMTFVMTSIVSALGCASSFTLFLRKW